MNVKNRILSLPIIAAVLFSVGIALSSYVATQALHSIRMTRDIDYPILAHSGALQVEMNNLVEAFNNAVGDSDKKGLEEVILRADKFREHLRNFMQIPGAEIIGGNLGSDFNSYFDAANKAARLMMEIDKGDPQPVVAKMQASLKKLTTELEAANRAAQKQFSSGVASSEGNVHFVILEGIVMAVVILGALALLSVLVVRAIWKELGGEPGYAREIAQAVAEGNLSMTIIRKTNDSHSLLAVLDEMKQRLATTVGKIRDGAVVISTGSTQIAADNFDLSRRTEQQASSLEETVSAMDALTSTVKKNSDNAKQATQLAMNSSEVAIRGGSVVGEVIDTMNSINDSSKKIVDIISVIDGIAFQTNILALNAAVEAARAGEQGRGFAVVANEVRSLAQRSASAAKEIKILIGSSVSKVDAGSKLVEQAGVTIHEVVESVKRVTNIVSEISAASQEQGAGIEEINRAIAQMDVVTQKNAALVEEAATSSQSLQDQAKNLEQVMSAFKLN